MSFDFLYKSEHMYEGTARAPYAYGHQVWATQIGFHFCRLLPRPRPLIMMTELDASLSNPFHYNITDDAVDIMHPFDYRT